MPRTSSQVVRHTAGPWEVTGATQIVKFGKDWACIAEVHNLRSTKTPDDSMATAEPARPSNPRFHEACANARLIAAAPALLDALHFMVHAFAHLPDVPKKFTDVSDVFRAQHDALIEANALLQRLEWGA